MFVAFGFRVWNFRVLGLRRAWEFGDLGKRVGRRGNLDIWVVRGCREN